jgi:hypothetical protein
MTVIARKHGLLPAIGLSVSIIAPTAAMALNVSLTAQTAGRAPAIDRFACHPADPRSSPPASWPSGSSPASSKTNAVLRDFGNMPVAGNSAS